MHTSNLSQAIVDQIIRSGKLWPHIEACCAFYARQRDAMVNAIQTHLPKRVRYTVPDGGIFIWASLDEGKTPWNSSKRRWRQTSPSCPESTSSPICPAKTPSG